MNQLDIIYRHTKPSGIWRGDTPPRLGWYPASKARNIKAWRWWDGKRWSSAAFVFQSDVEAARTAARGDLQKGIEWMEWLPKSKGAKKAWALMNGEVKS